MNTPDCSEDTPVRPSGPGLSSFKQRSGWFVWLISFWALVILVRMSQIMVFNRHDYLDDISRQSWHRGMIPAQRGRLLDSNGMPLAWSVRRLRFQWHIPASSEEAWEQWGKIPQLPGNPLRLQAKDLPRFYGREVILLNDVQAEQAQVLNELSKDCPSFKLFPWFVRCRVGSADLRRSLGQTIQKNGMEIGLTGYEKVHDSILRGRPGLFRVMLDPDGQWIMDTWEKTQEMQPGYDVLLPQKQKTN